MGRCAHDIAGDLDLEYPFLSYIDLTMLTIWRKIQHRIALASCFAFNHSIPSPYSFSSE